MSDDVNKNSVQETEKLSAVLEVRGQEYTFNYSIEDVDKFTKKYHIYADASILAVAELEAYYVNKSKYSVPGFRKGKASLKQIKNYYGDQVFFNDAIDYIIDNIYRVVYTTLGVGKKTAASPDLDFKGVTDTSLEYAYVITMYPEVGELKYSGLEIHLQDTEKYINELAEKKLAQARENVGSWENVEGRPVQSGDTANIDYEGKLDGVPFEGGADNGHDLLIGSNSFIPGFEDGVIGMNVGETKDINVTFPTEYHAQDLAGKDVVFTVKVNEIKNKVLPELDDEFAKDVSEFDTLADYMASLKAEAEKEGKDQVENINSNIIFDTVVDANDYEIPPKALEEAGQDELKKLEANLEKAGIPLDAYFGYIGQTKESFLADIKTRESMKLKSSIVLSAIAEKEEIKINPEDVEADILEKAEKTGKTVETYKQEMTRDEYDYIINSLFSKKVLARLKELNTLVVDK